jgi:uncharacterized membrane protein YozB (DUF420 family)
MGFFVKTLFSNFQISWLRNFISSIGLGHPRFILTDANMIIQIMILVSFNYLKKGKLTQHGILMGLAVILHFLTFVSVMGPIFNQNFEFFSTETSFLLVQTTWLHAIPGAIALLLAIFLVGKWLIHASVTASCYKRRRIMDVTLIFWLTSLMFGIVTYVLIYL